MLNQEEEQLADLLKRAVPEPPRELSADRVTAGRRARGRGPRAPWTRPALAAAAVLIIGVTTGVAAGHSGPGKAPAPRRTGQPAASASSASPSRTPAGRVRGVAVPNVVGMTAEQAVRVLEQDGLVVQVIAEKAPPGQPVPAGIVFMQSPAAGVTVPDGAAVTVTVQPAG